ncbi:MAG: SpoIIE family protein phosphatase, partial [Defluviitaleaceae bacterium]|nr:SpoIIE family protein phosphatase [Defluviitaleaceae bacterium]
MNNTSDEKRSFGEILNSLSRSGVTVLLAFACFFMGRAQVAGGIFPLVVAAPGAVFLGVSTHYSVGRRFVFMSIASLAGHVTRFDISVSITYFAAIGILWMIQLFFSDKLRSSTSVHFKAAVVGASMFFAGIGITAIRGLTAYSLMMSILEAVLAFSLSYILYTGHKAISDAYAAKTEALSPEELLCVSFLAGGVVMGAADIWVGFFALRYVMCAFLILVINKAVGRAAIAAGIVLGVLVNAAGFEGHGFTVTLAAAAMFCGLHKRGDSSLLANKYVNTGIFLTAKIVFGLYFGIFSVSYTMSVLLGGVIFMALPNLRILNSATDLLSASGIGIAEYYGRVSGITASKLRETSVAFSRLAAAFGGVTKPRTGLTMGEVRSLLDDVIAKSCLDCVKNNICWEGDDKFYRTYQKAFDALKNCDLLTPDEVEKSHMDFCIRRKEFYTNMRHLFEIYRNDLKWRNYLGESRHMAQVQLQAAAGIVGDMAAGLKFNGKFDLEMEKKLKHAFIKAGITFSQIFVVLNKDGRVEVTVKRKPCGVHHKCAEIARVTAETLGRKIRNEEKKCSYGDGGKAMGECVIKLHEEAKLRVTYGAAVLPAADGAESGDCFSHIEHSDKRITLILSDGMGKGKAAAEQSRATVELFEDFVDAGFDKNVSARLINSALLLKASGDENFSTLDVCSIDTHTGRAEFLKVGAAATFVWSQDGGAEAINSYSLPAGILDNVEPETVSRRVAGGDIIVMMTDGVLDSL